MMAYKTAALKLDPRLKMAEERCTTPRQITPLNSPVSLLSEVQRIHERRDQPGRRR